MIHARALKFHIRKGAGEKIGIASYAADSDCDGCGDNSEEEISEGAVGLEGGWCFLNVTLLSSRICIAFGSCLSFDIKPFTMSGSSGTRAMSSCLTCGNIPKSLCLRHCFTHSIFTGSPPVSWFEKGLAGPPQHAGYKRCVSHINPCSDI